MCMLTQTDVYLLSSVFLCVTVPPPLPSLSACTVSLQIEKLKAEVAQLKASSTTQTAEALAGRDQKDVVRECSQTHPLPVCCVVPNFLGYT